MDTNMISTKGYHIGPSDRRCTMHDEVLLLTAEKVQDIVQKQGSITLSHLESALEVSFNLIFLALDRLAAEHKIRVRRGEWDYIISHRN